MASKNFNLYFDKLAYINSQMSVPIGLKAGIYLVN